MQNRIMNQPVPIAQLQKLSTDFVIFTPSALPLILHSHFQHLSSNSLVCRKFTHEKCLLSLLDVGQYLAFLAPQLLSYQDCYFLLSIFFRISSNSFFFSIHFLYLLQKLFWDYQTFIHFPINSLNLSWLKPCYPK